MDALVEFVGRLEDHVYVFVGVGLVLLVAATWSAPQAGLAIAGAVIGSFAAPIVPPYFADADRVMISFATGAGAGALIGAAIGAVIAAWRRTSRPRRRARSTASVVSRASLGGLTGLVIVGYGVALSDRFGADFDLRSLYAGLLGGTLGWAAGAFHGWTIATRDDGPSSGERAILLVLAVFTIATGALVVASIRSASFGPMIDNVGPGNPRLVPVEVVGWIGTAVVTATFVWLALRPAAGDDGAGSGGGGLH
ncbi:MAG TPA: hypothetical protein VLA82_09250 [Actinomycetota bacterium]|nr:hypothetical protein [Actinomycetota bacterium]